MDKISDKLDLKTRGDFRQLAESSKPENAPDFDSQGLMWEVWDRMTEYYGAAFVSQYGEEPSATWAAYIQKLTPEQVRQGFELLPTRDSAFPPNPGEFINLIGTDSSWQRQCHKHYQPDRMLEDKTAREKRQAFSAEQLRNILAGFD